MYQSHKGWTSNLLNIKLNLNYKEYQSHKGWTSNNINDLSWDELTNRINPTRGGRQTLYLQLCIYSLYFVSIPQGVDVKHYNANILHWQSSVSIPQGVDVKHSTGIVLEVVSEVSIPQGVDVKLFLCDLIVYYRQYQSHKGWTSNSPILALMLAF